MKMLRFIGHPDNEYTWPHDRYLLLHDDGGETVQLLLLSPEDADEEDRPIPMEIGLYLQVVNVMRATYERGGYEEVEEDGS